VLTGEENDSELQIQDSRRYKDFMLNKIPHRTRVRRNGSLIVAISLVHNIYLYNLNYNFK